ncbi:MAG: ATPase, T2SS/T4P/T4SS family [Myxococcota bacterium]
MSKDESSKNEFRERPNTAVRKALDEVSRDDFADVTLDRQASARFPVLLGSPPPLNAVGALVHGLQIVPGDRVLEVGTGTGYTAALLSQLGVKVVTYERIPAMARTAERVLEQLGGMNVDVRQGDGLRDLEDETFDAILVSASGATVPSGLLKHLEVGGRLLVPLGTHDQPQQLVRITRVAEDDFDEELLGEIDYARGLGDILIHRGAVTPEDLSEVTRHASETGKHLWQGFVDEGYDETSVFRALAEQSGLQFGNVRDILRDIDPAVFGRLSHAYMEFNHVIPIRIQHGRATVVTSQPGAAFTGLGAAMGVDDYEICLVTPTDFQRLWRALSSGRLEHEDVDFGEQVDTVLGSDRDLMSTTRVDTKMVALFESMLLDAVAERASDIHLERYDEGVRVRFRIDGELVDMAHYNIRPDELRGLVNIIKINAGLDIAERRLPQGGRFRRRSGGKTFDLRVQTQPTLHGEYAVIRLLPQDQRILDIQELGFPPDVARDYRRLLDSPGGMILVVGPTGSGKSTTLYAGLQVLAADASRKVITVEDPIEYSIAGVEQTQARPQIGFAFSDAMRSFVRQDPDVILVGEIRDGETALEAIRASQTGHLVLSTLHTNDAVDVIQRLLDLGMQPNSIASELIAVIAQRLAKRICKNCKEPADPEPEILAELYPDETPDAFECYRGQGCSVCGGRGTRGRIAVIEYLRVREDMRKAISRRLPVDELRDIAVDAGLHTMRESAIWLVNRGIVPLEELPRVLPAERMAPEA